MNEFTPTVFESQHDISCGPGQYRKDCGGMPADKSGSKDAPGACVACPSNHYKTGTGTEAPAHLDRPALLVSS